MTNLYVIENPEELIGKTIAYIEMENWLDRSILITTDGGIIIWETSGWPDGSTETVICDSDGVESYLFKEKALQGHIIAKGICQEEDYIYFLARQTEKRRKEREYLEKQQEERDRQEYERLKMKFEGV